MWTSTRPKVAKSMSSRPRQGAAPTDQLGLVLHSPMVCSATVLWWESPFEPTPAFGEPLGAAAASGCLEQPALPGGQVDAIRGSRHGMTVLLPESTMSIAASRVGERRELL